MNSTPSASTNRFWRPGLLLLATGLFLLFPGVHPGLFADGDTSWRRADPEAFGLDSRKLAEAYRRARELRPLNSLLVSRRGRLIGERYFLGAHPGKGVNIKSASKAVLSALVGIALEEGALRGLDQPIGPFFSDLLDKQTEPRKWNITLRELLLMRSGLRTTSFHNYGQWVTSDHWVRHVLNQPLIHPPGTRTTYSTGNSHLVAVILKRAVGRDLRVYAQKKLFDPLGVRIHGWQKDPQGNRFGGNNMALPPRGLHRFGQLYLNRGRFKGRRVLRERWIRTSTRGYVHDTFNGFPYGYYWWIGYFDGVRVQFAWGHGGQYVFVVPAYQLVVTCTSAPGSGSDGNNRHSERVRALFEEHILGAVESPVR